MKKLMFILAVILAAGTSSFAHLAAGKQAPSYFWYKVNASNQIVSGSQAYGAVKRTVSYAQINLPCPSGADADCVRGFNSQITSFPSMANGDTAPLQKQN